MISESGERIAERRQLPVQHGKNFRAVTRDDEVVETVVTMHQPRSSHRRNMRRQPRDQPFHLFDLFGFRGAVLLRPGLDLASDVILAAPEIGKPDSNPAERAAVYDAMNA